MGGAREAVEWGRGNWYSQMGWHLRQYIRKAGAYGDKSWVVGGHRYRTGHPHKGSEGTQGDSLCCGLLAPLRGTRFCPGSGGFFLPLFGIPCSGWARPLSQTHGGALLAGTISGEVFRLKGDS